MNHRVFECKLHPRPRLRERLPGHRTTNHPRPPGAGARSWLSVPLAARSAKNHAVIVSPRRRTMFGSRDARSIDVGAEHRVSVSTNDFELRPQPHHARGAAVWTLHATPGQARTPAEFKHITKRRKRNL
eukprot:Gb_37694 [translate_table: standard]